MLNGFGVVVNSLGGRVKPYLPQICGTILWRLNNKAAKVRQQAADLISRISSVMHECNEVSAGEGGREGGREEGERGRGRGDEPVSEATEVTVTMERATAKPTPPLKEGPPIRQPASCLCLTFAPVSLSFLPCCCVRSMYGPGGRHGAARSDFVV